MDAEASPVPVAPATDIVVLLLWEEEEEEDEEGNPDAGVSLSFEAACRTI